MLRRSHVTASASAPTCNLAIPTNIIHRNALISRGERRSASLIWASVSTPRPRRNLAQPMQAFASALIHSQRLLTFGDAFDRAGCKDVDDTPREVGCGEIR